MDFQGTKIVRVCVFVRSLAKNILIERERGKEREKEVPCCLSIFMYVCKYVRTYGCMYAHMSVCIYKVSSCQSGVYTIYA